MAPPPGDLAGRWRAMSPREQIGVVVLGVAALGFIGYRTFYQGQVRQLGRSRAEWRALRQQVEAARAALPNVEQERQRLPVEASENDVLAETLAQAQRRLMTTGELGRLVGELTKQGEGFPVAFEAIKQHVKNDAERPEVTLDVVFTAPYDAMVNYLRRVERLSPFLRVAKLDIAEPKEGPAASGRTTVTLVAPLTPSSEPGGLSQTAAAPPPERMVLPRNPFGSTARPAASEAAADLKVTGITWRGRDSTAIINDEVVRIGDTVDHQVIQQILPTGVVVSDGVRTQTLPLEGQ